MVKSTSVAVIDIGSNSIKVLVAARGPAGEVRELKSRTIDARISAGIGRAKPRLSAKGMAAGLAAIKSLLATAASFAPAKTVLVATSAVRDASNGAVFRRRVKAATGRAIRILSGKAEANFIGRGLLCDPALAGLRNFYVFDLGGGSLECLLFRDRRIHQAASLPLGCVRLTERFISDVNAPLSADESAALGLHVRDTLKRSGFLFPVIAPAAVFAGGSMTTVRVIQAAQQGLTLEETPAILPMEELAGMLNLLAPLSLDQRKSVPGMPAPRADVFPTALITMLAVADYARIRRFHHSLHNLRWGLAADVLGLH